MQNLYHYLYYYRNPTYANWANILQSHSCCKSKNNFLNNLYVYIYNQNCFSDFEQNFTKSPICQDL